jgi:hypothetical protein
MNVAFYLCFLVLRGISEEKLYVNSYNIMFFEREAEVSSKGKEQLTRLHMVDKTVIAVRNDMDDIMKKLHSCREKTK